MINKNGTQLELFEETRVSVLKGFGCFGEATKEQKEFAKKLGINLTGIPKNVAIAMMNDTIRTGFNGMKTKLATQKQVEFGKQFNWDFSCMTSSIAFAYIKNILWELNFVIIEQQRLRPGVWTENIYNKEKRQILSIDKNGLVRFADLRRPYRYARSLLRCNAPEDSKSVPARNRLTEQTHEQFLSRLVECILLETGAAT